MTESMPGCPTPLGRTFLGDAEHHSASTVQVAAGSPRTSVQLHQVLPLVERQHRVIEELRGRAPRPLAAAALARRLGVRARTIERDVARLREAGVPVQVSRGRGGGYAIDGRAELPPIVFTPGEAAALIASVVALGPFASASAQTSLSKLLAAFGPGGRDGAVGALPP